MPKLVAFSGGCFSGKTSTMKALKSVLESKGYKVVLISERIRELLGEKSIDSVRANPKEYLELQIQAISMKINDEYDAVMDKIMSPRNNHRKGDTIYLIDRALTDSLFYLTNYTSKLKNSQQSFADIYNRLRETLEKQFGYYDLIIEFTPLSIKASDVTADNKRPINIDALKEYEYNEIRKQNEYYMKNFGGSAKIMYVDLSSSPQHEDIISQIVNKIENV